MCRGACIATKHLLLPFVTCVRSQCDEGRYFSKMDSACNPCSDTSKRVAVTAMFAVFGGLFVLIFYFLAQKAKVRLNSWLDVNKFKVRAAAASSLRAVCPLPVCRLL